MADYDVTKDKKTGEWKAKREKADRVSGYYSTQVEAEKAAKQFARNNGGGEVRVHRPNGQIRDSDTVLPAQDPFPPRDKKH